MITDHQDDLGAFLRQTRPDIADSHFIKEATWQEKPEMMDREFAVILVEPNGREHRKLAMSDAGNTLASLTYLLTSEHELPESAVKLASYNLLNAAMHYGLYDEYGDNLLRHEKLGSAFDVLAYLADTLPNQGIIDERRVSVKEAMQGMAGYDPNAKTVAQTGAMPNKPGSMLGKAPKMGGTMPMGTPGKTAYASAEPTTAYDLIKEAQFMWPELDPVDKRRFALIIKEAAIEEAASVPPKIAQYSGEELNPQFETIMHRRLDYVSNEELRNDYQRFSKVAYAMDLADATETLYLLDEQAGLLNRYGTNLPDPVLSVYGCSTKEAMWSWNHGGDYCTIRDLELLCSDPIKRNRMESMFSSDIIDAMCKDPIKTFESRPIEQQIILSRMSNHTGM